MCSIFGAFTSTPDAGSAHGAGQALDATRYRGPDNTAVCQLMDGRLTLGHNRLSILDLSPGANQPMCDAEEEVWIVYNGEIYNFLEVRRELERRGHRFRTDSDTEVILRAYRDRGIDCLQEFDGMFALCIVDLRDNTLTLARDLCGEKPLYYYCDHGRLVFASELQQLLAQDISRTFLPERVGTYFSLGYLPGDQTFFREVAKLPPAHVLRYDCGTRTARLRPYWSLPPFERGIPEGAVLEELDRLFRQSTQRRMIADVPLGAFLSGGIDSTLTASYMSATANAEVKTYSISFAGSRADEAPLARMVASHLGTSHTEIAVDPDIAATAELLAEAIDEPIYDNSLIPTYILCQQVKPHVTVALSGDGGDEIFAGYVHYLAALRCHQLGDALPGWLHPLVRHLGLRLPHGMYGRRTLASMGRGPYECFTYQRQVFADEERARLLRIPDPDPSPVAYRNGLMAQHRGDFVNRMCAADIASGLPQILTKVDRASMLNSLEVRTPFLNREIIELAFRSVPGAGKLRRGRPKHLLKELLSRHVPPGYPLERKQGFDIPADLLARSRFLELVRDLDVPDFLDAGEVRRLTQRQARGRGQHWHQLFAVFMFARWYAKWVA